MSLWRPTCILQFLILLILFTWLGLTPDPGHDIREYNDKLMHFSGYWVAGFSISFAFPRWYFWRRAVFLIIFSIGIEIGQHFLPPRTFDLFDICANSAGVVTGLFCIFLLQNKVDWFNQLLFYPNE
jgi:VanZ family protein